MGDEEGFKVTDRRGRLREEANTAPGPAPSAADRRPEAGPPAPESPPGPVSPSEALGSDLAGIFLMFASSALVQLGEAVDPTTGARTMDLEQARSAIDILHVLREKTEGNRTADESALLEELLYDLQLRYVRAAGGRP